MVLNELGRITQDEWKKTGIIRKNVMVDEFVIMPNHLHGILVIENDCSESDERRDVLLKRLYWGPNPHMSKISPHKNSISVAIRFFKRQTTIRIRKIFPNFSWQSNYYDRIIRNKEELNRIREYIIWNPKAWENDRNNSENISV